MTTNIFKNLWDRFQIPNHIPILLPEKFEKCYSGKIKNVGMYDAMFAAGLRLPLMTLHCQLDYSSAKLLQMLRGYSLELKSYGVVLMVGTISLHWTSSFGAIDLNTSSRLKGYTILRCERKSLDSCWMCLIPIEIERADISSFRGQIGYAV